MPPALKTRHLQVFLAVAKAGSMQHAARVVQLSQPAISKLVGELESIFGAPLFERSKRGVTPTECGHALMARARLMLNDFESAKGEISAIASGAIGRVRVGVLPVAEAILSRTLLALRSSAPGLAVLVEDGNAFVLLNALRQGDIDCMISRIDVGTANQDLHIEKLVQMPISVVTSPTHPLARAKRVSWSELTTYPWILPRIGAPIRAVIDHEFTGVGLSAPIPTIESSSVRINRMVVAATDMITVMVYDAARSYARSGELAILPVRFATPSPYIGVITRTSQVSLALGTFLTTLRAQCKR
jgi:DNA-binding transcriptional LysR family regulator